MSTTAIWPRTGRTAPAGRPCPATCRLQAPAASTTAPASIGPALVVHADRPAALVADGEHPAGDEAGAGPLRRDRQRAAQRRGSSEPSSSNQRAPRASGERPGSSRAHLGVVEHRHRQAGRLELGGAPRQQPGVVVVERHLQRAAAAVADRDAALAAPAPRRRPGSGPARRAPARRRARARGPRRRARGCRRRRSRPRRRGWSAPAPPPPAGLRQPPGHRAALHARPR